MRVLFDPEFDLGAWPGPPAQDVVYVALPDSHGPLAGVVAEALPGAVFVSSLPRPGVAEDENWTRSCGAP